jgi:hypothetical protein
MEINELPESELILAGLEDLYHGRNNIIGSLKFARGQCLACSFLVILSV